MNKLQILPSLLAFAAAVFTTSCKDAKVPYAQNDVLETPKLSDVKIEGAIGKKMDTFFRERVFSDYAKREIFGEAESAFENPQDDAKKVVGLWQGEFWGKLAISGSRVAQYSKSADLAKFLESSADRLITHQQPDGYLGTYKDKMFLRVNDLEAAKKVMKWSCNWCWNIWCRKYTLWGLLEIYELGGNPKYLEAARRSAVQLIDMLRANNVRICDTGTFEGMPSMSILKPMLILYRNTGDKKFLEFSREIVGYLDRDDGTPPNLIRNSFSDKPVHEWYPLPEKWAKAYEMMSCMEGVLEYYRITGDKRCLEAVERFAEKIWKFERNPLASVGYNDQFAHAASEINGITEPCDAIHWMRLNLDLYTLTGNLKYVDVLEETFCNAFLAGVFRDGKWGARGVRSHCRTMYAELQSGFTKNHCCVDNIPRGFLDMAQAIAQKSRDGTIRVNLYFPCKVELDGAKIEISDGYLQTGVVRVKINSKTPQTVAFRIPRWSKKTLLDGAQVNGGFAEISVDGSREIELQFDHSARVVDSNLPAKPIAKNSNSYYRWYDNSLRGIDNLMRSEPAATIMVGPLILAKSKLLGDTEAEIFDFETVNKSGATCTLKPIKSDTTMCAWEAEIKSPKGTVKTKVCDLSSAGDFNSGAPKTFSIFF